MSRNLASIILFLAGGLVLYFFFIPQLARLKATQTDYKAANDAFLQLKNISAKRDELRDIYNSVKAADLAKATQMVPKGSDTKSTLAEIESLARQNGILLRAIDFRNSEQSLSGQGVLVLPVSLQVTGRYDSLYQFLHHLEADARLMDVVSVNFAVSSQDPNIVDANIAIKTYYQ